MYKSEDQQQNFFYCLILFLLANINFDAKLPNIVYLHISNIYSRLIQIYKTIHTHTVIYCTYVCVYTLLKQDIMALTSGTFTYIFVCKNSCILEFVVKLSYIRTLKYTLFITKYWSCFCMSNEDCRSF